MSRNYRVIASLAALMLGGLAGCRSKEIKVERPDRPEEWVLPPDHPRFSQPIAYPRDLLNKGPIQKNDSGPATPSPMRPVGQMGQPGPSL